MTIDGVVVLYNPKDDVYDHVNSYLPFLKRLFVIDNSTQYNEDLLAKLKKIDKIQYVSLGGNMGIAKALKEGLKLSVDDADYTLTMDQDSIFPTDKIDYIKGYLEKYKDEYAIIGLNILEEGEKDVRLVEEKLLLTSGNFILNSDYKKIEGFNEDLFIDWVDFDLCRQFYDIGKKVGFINEVLLNHTIGNPLAFKFLGKTRHTLNHPPIRYYYRYRNGLYLYKRNKKYYRKKYWHDIFLELLKMTLAEDNRREKWRMVRRGRRDARKKILGPYKEK